MVSSRAFLLSWACGLERGREKKYRCIKDGRGTKFLLISHHFHIHLLAPHPGQVCGGFEPIELPRYPSPHAPNFHSPDTTLSMQGFDDVTNPAAAILEALRTDYRTECSFCSVLQSCKCIWSSKKDKEIILILCKKTKNKNTTTNCLCA